MNIFDPLSIIIKLGILSKKPIGTKISLKNYILQIQEPSYFLGFIRYFNDDNKNDIQYLINPIKIACSTYLNINNKSLFVYAQVGLNKLINLYDKYPIIINTLKYAYLIIDIYINNLLRDKILLKYESNINILQNKINILKKSVSNSSSPKTLSRSSSINNIKLNEKSISRSSSINEDLNYNNNYFSRSSTISDIDNNFNNETKSIVYRFSATGYFSLDSEQNDNEKICDEIITNLNNFDDYNYLIMKYNVLINNNNYDKSLINDFNDLWNNNEINNINKLFDNYINSNFKMMENIIDKYMIDIDNKVIKIIMNYYYKK